MHMQGYSPKELTDILRQHNWQQSHRKGSHITFENTYTHKTITIVDHGNTKEMSRPLVKRLLKETGLLGMVSM